VFVMAHSLHKLKIRLYTKLVSNLTHYSDSLYLISLSLKEKRHELFSMVSEYQLSSLLILLVSVFPLKTLTLIESKKETQLNR